MSKSVKIILAAFLLLCILLGIVYVKNEPEFIDKARYEALLEQGAISEATLQGAQLILRTSSGRFAIIKEGIDMNALTLRVPVKPAKEFDSGFFVFIALGLLAMFVSAAFFARKRQADKFPIRKPAQTPVNSLDNINSIKPVISSVSFEDVAGVDEVKVELAEIVDFLKNPQKYKEFGVKMPKGVLMVGPPGVGKTLIAKAVAGEASVPFFYQSGSSFVEIYVGMGAKRVRELFSRAKAMSPSIIFIDEIDAVGKARGDASNVERDSTLNQLLTQMDGFEDNSGVIVIAATNKIELMDPALLRSGRFDRRIFLSLPDFKDRLKILEIYMRGKKNSVNLTQIAKASVGFSGAALETLVNEAAINALRRGASQVEESDFYEVLNKVLVGKKKILTFSEDEKKIQATYQAAKALSAYYFDIGFEKITLIEDRFNEYEHHIKSKSELLNKIKVYLAGSCAMQLIYNESYTNSQSDLIKAKELLGFMLSFDMADEKLLDEQRREIQNYLAAMKDKIKSLAQILLEQEKLESADVARLVNEEMSGKA